MPHVIQYFAKSLNIIRNDTICACGGGSGAQCMTRFLLLAASFDGLQPVLAACHCNFFSTLANKLLLLLLYQHSIVTVPIAYLVPFMRYSASNNGVTFKSRLGITQGHWNPFNRSHTSSCWRSVVTMALSCIISEIKRDIGRKSRFLNTPPAFDVPIRVGVPVEILPRVWYEKLNSKKNY